MKLKKNKGKINQFRRKNLCNLQVTTQLFSGRLLDYGSDAGDKELSQGLDVGKKLHLSRPIFFYGQEYSSIYVLSNGAIGFESSARTYRSNILPGRVKIIAPFWNRNDLRNGGRVFFREVSSPFIRFFTSFVAFLYTYYIYQIYFNPISFI